MRSGQLSIAAALAAAALAAATLLGGCASTAVPTPSPTATPTAVATPAPPTPEPTPTRRIYTYKDMVVGFIQTGSESGWRAANTASFKDTATILGITLRFYDSQNKLQNQVLAFREYVADPAVDVVVLAALSPSGWDDLLKEARAAGKIVVLEDSRIDADPSLYLTYVGSDYEAEGRNAAKAMCDALKGFASKNVVEIAGASGSASGIDRAKGFREQMSDCGMTITATQVGISGTPESKAAMKASLGKLTDIQGIFVQNDDAAAGAIEAIKAAGLKPNKDVFVVGIDATPDGFKYLITGELFADMESNPLLAPQIYQAALNGLNGDAIVPKWIPAQEGAFFASQGADALRAIFTRCRCY